MTGGLGSRRPKLHEASKVSSPCSGVNISLAFNVFRSSRH